MFVLAFKRVLHRQQIQMNMLCPYCVFFACWEGLWSWKGNSARVAVRWQPRSPFWGCDSQVVITQINTVKCKYVCSGLKLVLVYITELRKHKSSWQFEITALCLSFISEFIWINEISCGDQPVTVVAGTHTSSTMLCIAVVCLAFQWWPSFPASCSTELQCRCLFMRLLHPWQLLLVMGR